MSTKRQKRHENPRGKHLKMTEKGQISLHKTERLAAALKYCELRSGKCNDHSRYIGIWHAIFINRRVTLPQRD